MRQMEFKMERTGLLNIGDVLPVTESKLPNSYYYTLGHAYAMSGNYPTLERLKKFAEAKGGDVKSVDGTVVDIQETPKGFFVTVEFDE
ncbi:MAG: hypothetical protein K6A05_09490 [Lachnospiraceae bacterium]|nr:hypothetical protein [Lachnospiraceae bacterium]